MQLIKELFRLRRYKLGLGRLIRRLTMAGVWVLFVTAAWKCSHLDFTVLANWITWFAGWNTQLATAKEAANTELVATLTDQIAVFNSTFVPVFTYSLAGMLLCFGLWFGYRLVNWETFADFLIAVEGEMAKVSWPGKAELKSSTIVVLTMFLLLAGMIYIFDLLLVFLIRSIGI